MERKSAVTSMKPRWVKTTPGTLVLRKPTSMRLKHKQEFNADISELGPHWKENFKLLENGTGKYAIDEAIFVENPLGGPKVEKAEIKELKSGKFNVVFESGKKVNTKSLTLEEAESLMDKINSNFNGDAE